MKNLSSFTAKALAMTVVLFMGIADYLSAQKVAIIDAGSSGSRLYVYEVNVKSHEKIKLLFPQNKEEKKLCKGRALSGVANNTDSVRAYVQTMTAKYPCDDADLYVFATAGMRLKPKELVEAVYDKIEKVGEVNGYDVKEAMTISGQYEGLYGWLAANYLNGKIKITKSSMKKGLKAKRKTYGILEIGGASLQLAFSTKKDHEDCLSRPGLGKIYCRSYLGGGVDQVYKKNDKSLDYVFDMKFDNVSYLYKSNATFLGLGIPVNNVLKGIAKATDQKTYEDKINSYIHSLDDFVDCPANYHPRMNSHYIKGVLSDFDLEEKIQSPKNDASWTIGAAIDILINKEVPEEYNHDNPN